MFSNHYAFVLQGKKVTSKKAEAKQGKIYVGKLPAGETLSKEDIQNHFSEYGQVVEVVRPVDKMKNNEPKTFAFVTFAREDSAKQLVKAVSFFLTHIFNFTVRFLFEAVGTTFLFLCLGLAY